MLNFFGRAIPIVIEPNLANRHHLLMGCQRPDLRQPAILPPGSRIRVDTDGGIHAVVLFSQANYFGKIRWINRGHDDAVHASRPGPCYHLVPILIKTVKIQMTMGINQHTAPSITDARPGTIGGTCNPPGPKCATSCPRMRAPSEKDAR